MTRHLLTLTAVLTLAACSSDATAPWAPVPDVVTASVVAVGPPTDRTYVLVDGGETAASGGAAGRYALVVSGATDVLVRQPSGRLVLGRLGDIVPGASVRAWRTGVELRSLPPQYPVTRIEVTPAPTR